MIGGRRSGRDRAGLGLPLMGLNSDLAAMARFEAAFWAVAGVIALFVALAPGPDEASSTGFLALGAGALAVALILYLTAGRLPAWALHGALFLGTAMISLAIYFTGEHSGAPATDMEMLYIWVAIFSAYLLTSVQATLQIGWIAVCYWFVLLLGADDSVFAARWAETVGTLAIVSVLIQALRERIVDLLRRLGDAARTDPLTGLQNRRAFEENFGIEVERANRHGRPLSVLVGDLDHFKLVNDRLGHPAGDAALVRIGELLREARRRIDPVARTGGEEFALILPEADETESYRVAERLRTAIEQDFAQRPVPVTVSLGLATFPDHGTTADGLLAAADRALYAAKEMGRNRTVIYSQEISSAMPAPGMSAASSEVQLGTLIALADAIDLRDGGGVRHSREVGRYAALIAAELGLGPVHARRLEIAGTLHDIGKVGLPDSILRKAEPLDEIELSQIQRHPQIAADILGGGPFEDVRGWVLAHQERLDGSGFPAGLRGSEIPLEARILAVADAYESMTADRANGAAMGADVARTELRRQAGRQLDRDAVGALLRVLSRERVGPVASPR